MRDLTLRTGYEAARGGCLATFQRAKSFSRKLIHDDTILLINNTSKKEGRENISTEELCRRFRSFEPYLDTF
jgi:hypothetical protein